VSTSISSAGTYGAGDYHLSADIAVSGSDAITFVGDASLDLNGHTIIDVATGNTASHGVNAGATLTLHDSGASEGIKGFRVAVKADGPRSKVNCVKITARYMGIWLGGDDSAVVGCHIAEIGGVADEPYAIGVQVGSAKSCRVERTTFRNLYRQTGFTGTAAGEGLPVNFSSNSSACTMRECVCINDRAQANTIGVFAGSGGGHAIRDNIFHNFAIGPAAVSALDIPITGNRVTIEAPISGSIGISGEGCTPVGNIVIGPFDTLMLTASQADNFTDASQIVTPRVSVNAPSLGEGPTVAFTVNLVPAGVQTVTVDWATSDGTAIAGSDYIGASGRLTFAPGETSKTIEIAIADDAVEEGSKTFTVTLSNPSGATIANAVGVGTIWASDAANGERVILDHALDTNFGNIAGKTARIEIKASALIVPPGAPSRIRVTLRATGDEPFSIGAAYVGHKAAYGKPWDATQVTQLLVGGQRGFTVPTGGAVTTDWLDFAWDKSSDLVVSLYCDGDAAEDKMPAMSDTVHATHLKLGNEAGLADASGYYSYPGYLSAVSRIETDGF